MKITGWIAAFILFLVVLYFQLCANKKLTNAVSNDDYNAMVKAKDDSIKHYKGIIKSDSDAINNAHMASAEQRDKAELYRRSLAESQNTVQRLSDKIEAAKKEKPNDAWVAVSPNYVEGCDSIRLAAIGQNAKIDQAGQDVTKLVELMDYEISLRDTALAHRDQFNASMTKQLEDCYLKLDTAIKNQQRTQVYAGVGMFGNKINPLAGGQVNVSLKTKGNKIYEVTGAAIGNTWYVGVGTKFLISFRRK
jgi:hypothetical protein